MKRLISSSELTVLLSKDNWYARDSQELRRLRTMEFTLTSKIYVQLQFKISYFALMRPQSGLIELEVAFLEFV